MRERQGGGELRQGSRATHPKRGGGEPGRKNIYVASYESDAVARLKRNPLTGAISQPAGKAGCISQTGAGPCADGHALHGPAWVAVSADGESVYATSRNDDAVVRFVRAP